MVKQDYTSDQKSCFSVCPTTILCIRTLARRKCANGVYCSAYVKACVSKTRSGRRCLAIVRAVTSHDHLTVKKKLLWTLVLQLKTQQQNSLRIAVVIPQMVPVMEMWGPGFECRRKCVGLWWEHDGIRIVPEHMGSREGLSRTCWPCCSVSTVQSRPWPAPVASLPTCCWVHFWSAFLKEELILTQHHLFGEG